jgi:hypothetical protein
MEYEFKAKLWEYDGPGAWHFITLPRDYGQEIKLVSSDFRKGFGSVKVEVTIGSSSWETSVFPDKQSDSYVLPIKKEIRSKENISAGNMVSLRIKIV